MIYVGRVCCFGEYVGRLFLYYCGGCGSEWIIGRRLERWICWYIGLIWYGWYWDFIRFFGSKVLWFDRVIICVVGWMWGISVVVFFLLFFWCWSI